MIDFDSLPSYKAQRRYSNYIIYLEYADGAGTWSVWETNALDPDNLPDPLMVYGDEKRGFLVRSEIVSSGAYTLKQEGIDAAKAFIDSLETALIEEEISMAA